MRLPHRSLLTGSVLLLTATAAASGASAASAPPVDGVNLKAPWVNGGAAWLELEDRNSEPAICFVWDDAAPHDGDSIRSTLLTVGGAEVVDLGVSDQWIDGSGEGCEIPRDDRYKDVFAHPAGYVAEFRVVESQGNPPTPPVRSQPLQPASG